MPPSGGPAVAPIPRSEGVAAPAPAPAPVAAPEPDAPLPRVVIEQIQVITPPAGPPEVDPFASLAARRSAGARAGGGR